MIDKKTKVLNTLRETLRFHEALGIHEYPASNEILRFLKTDDTSFPGHVQHHGNGDNGSRVPKGLESLVEEVHACTLCQLSRDPLGRVNGKGTSGSHLVVVGDWSSQSGTFSSETLFGKEEDVMLWKMMAAIDVQPGQVYVTNSLKCCPADSAIIDTNCEESCFSFLAREIAAVNPRVICAMGEMAVRVIMGTKEPLARLRGRFGRYRYQSGETVMVMPTFHPRFLLQHQEMKKATWNDLQAIKRFMKSS